jgi:hypothetical protein
MGRKGESVMKQNRYLLVTGVVTFICLIVAAVSTAIPDNGKKYEVDAVVDVSGGYKTDAARTIDAYERLMDRYMDLSDKLTSTMGGECQAVSTKLDSLDSRLADISTRLARIEKSLGIDPNSPVTTKRSK